MSVCCTFQLGESINLFVSWFELGLCHLQPEKSLVRREELTIKEVQWGVGGT